MCVSFRCTFFLSRYVSIWLAFGVTLIEKYLTIRRAKCSIARTLIVTWKRDNSLRRNVISSAALIEKPYDALCRWRIKYAMQSPLTQFTQSHKCIALCYRFNVNVAIIFLSHPVNRHIVATRGKVTVSQLMFQRFADCLRQSGYSVHFFLRK